MAKSSKKDTFVLLYESTYEMLKNRLRKCIIFSDVYIDVKLFRKKKNDFSKSHKSWDPKDFWGSFKFFNLGGS